MGYLVLILYSIAIFIVNYLISFFSYLKNIDKILECLREESRKKRSLFYEIDLDISKDETKDKNLVSFLKQIFIQSFYKGIPIFNKVEWLKKFFSDYKKGLRDKIIFIESVKKKIYLSIIGCFCIRVFFIYGLKLNTSTNELNYSIGGVEDILLNIAGVFLIILLSIIMNKNFDRKIMISKNNVEKLEPLIKYYLYIEEETDLKNDGLSFKDEDIFLMYKKDIIDLGTFEFLKELSLIITSLKIKEIKEGLSYTKEIDMYLEDQLNSFLSKENSNFLSFLEVFPILELFFIGGAIFFFLAIPIFSVI